MTNDKDLFSQINGLFEDVNLDQATNLIGGAIKPTGEEYEQELLDKLNDTDTAATEKLVEDITNNVREGEDLQDSIKTYLRTKLGLTVDETGTTEHVEVVEEVDPRIFMKNPEEYADVRAERILKEEQAAAASVDPSLYLKDNETDPEVVLPDPSIREDYITDMSAKLSQVLDQHGMRERWAKADDPTTKGDIYEKVEALSMQLNLLRSSVMESTMVSGIGQGGDGQLPGSGEVRLQKMDDVIMGEIEPGQTICWDPDYFGQDHGAWVPCDGGGGGTPPPGTIQPPLFGTIWGCTKLKECGDLYWGTEAQYKEFADNISAGNDGEAPAGAVLVKENISTLTGCIAVEYEPTAVPGEGDGEWLALGMTDCDGFAVQNAKADGISSNGNGPEGFFLVYEDPNGCGDTLVDCDKDAACIGGCQDAASPEDTYTNELRFGTQQDIDDAEAGWDPDTNLSLAVEENGTAIDGVIKILAASFEGCDKVTRKGKYNVYYNLGGIVKEASIIDDSDEAKNRCFFIANVDCDPTSPELPTQPFAPGCLAKDGCVKVDNDVNEEGFLKYGDGTTGASVLSDWKDPTSAPVANAQELIVAYHDLNELYVVEPDGSKTGVWVCEYFDFDDNVREARFEGNSHPRCLEGFYIESQNTCLDPDETPEQGQPEPGNLYPCLKTQLADAPILWGGDPEDPAYTPGTPARTEPNGGGSEARANQLIRASSLDPAVNDTDKIGQWQVDYLDFNLQLKTAYSPTDADDGTSYGFTLKVDPGECATDGVEPPELDFGCIVGCAENETGSPVYYGTNDQYENDGPTEAEYDVNNVTKLALEDGTIPTDIVEVLRPYTVDGTNYTIKGINVAGVDVTFKYIGNGCPEGVFLTKDACTEEIISGCPVDEFTIPPVGCQEVDGFGGELLFGKRSAIDENFADPTKYEVIDTNVQQIISVVSSEYCDNNFGKFKCTYIKNNRSVELVHREGINPATPEGDSDVFFLNPGSNKCVTEGGDITGDGIPASCPITGCSMTENPLGVALYWGENSVDSADPSNKVAVSDQTGLQVTNAKYILGSVSFNSDANGVGDWICIYEDINQERGTSTNFGTCGIENYFLDPVDCEVNYQQRQLYFGKLVDCNRVDENGDAGDLHWDTGNDSNNVDENAKARRVLATYTSNYIDTNRVFDPTQPQLWSALYLDDNNSLDVTGSNMGVSPEAGYYIEVDDINSYCAYNTEVPPGGACEDDLDCPPGFACVGGICEQLRCKLPGDTGYDPDKHDCPDGYICVQGICLKPCGTESGPLCPDGSHCITVPDPTDPNAPGFTVCVPGKECNGDCPDGTFCIDGECVILECPLNPDNSNDGIENGCPPGYICHNGQCLKPCDDQGNCPDGFQCFDVIHNDGSVIEEISLCFPIYGPCPPLGCPITPDANPDVECVLGACRETCTAGSCPAGFECFNGNCFPICTDEDDCPEGHICLGGGVCFPIYDCVDKDSCAEDPANDRYECFGGICRPVCDAVVNPDGDNGCPSGMDCFDGLCYEKCTDTKECPEGHQCVNGLCLPILACDADDCPGNDCKCPTNFECVEGVCRRICTPSDCPGDDCECPEGTKCYFGNCYPICTADGDCPEGHQCIGGICLPDFKCGDDDDCPGDMECVDGFCRAACTPGAYPENTEDDSCPPGFSCFGDHCFPKCTSDDMCPEGSYCIGGICVPQLECTPTECPDGACECPAGFVCIAGTCRPECNPNPDYNQGETECPAGHDCLEGICYPTCTDTDCPEGHYCIGDLCLPMVDCSDDVDCPPGFQCIAGTCRPVCLLADGTAKDCPDGFDCFNGVCYPSCLDENGNPKECPPGHICIGGTCYPIHEGCDADTDCPPGFECVSGVCRIACKPSDYPSNEGCPPGFYCYHDVCYPTCADTDCPPGSICIGGKCYPVVDCDPGGDCPPGFKCAPDGVCRPECTDDTECPTGFKCYEGFCWPSCENDACPPGYECYDDVCLPPIFCPDGADGSCPFGWVCVDGVCRPPCDGSGSCPPGYTCVDGIACWPLCNESNPCPEGYECINDICRPLLGCSETKDCPPDHICINGLCVKLCNDTSPCPDGFICTDDGYCLIGCTDDEGCPDGFVCWNGGCYPSLGCDPENPCPEGYTCLNGTCVKECGGNDDCPPGYNCDPDYNVCLLGCSDDTECPPGYSCLGDKCVPMFLCDDENPCPEGYRCVNGICLPLCVKDSDCPTGFICGPDGICIKHCNNNDECPLGFVCVDGTCEPAGRPDGPCGEKDECPEGYHCVLGKCRKDCDADKECPPNFICFEGNCLPVGRPEGPCGEEGCPPGYECILGICRKPCGVDCNDTIEGIDCNCLDNEECDDQTGACFPRLCDEETNPCPLGSICIDGRCRIQCGDGLDPCPEGYICTEAGICLPIDPDPEGPNQPSEPGPLPHINIGCEEVDISGTLYWGSQNDYLSGGGDPIIVDGALVKAKKIHANYVENLFVTGVGDYTCLYSEPGSNELAKVTLRKQSPINNEPYSYFIQPDANSTCVNSGETHDPVDGYISGCKETDRGGQLFWGTTSEALNPVLSGTPLKKNGVDIICKGIINVISVDCEDANNNKVGQYGTWQVFYRNLDNSNDMVAISGTSGPMGPQGAYMVAGTGSICIDNPFNVVTTRDVVLVNSVSIENARNGIIGNDNIIQNPIDLDDGTVIKYNTQEQANIVITDLLLELNELKPTVHVVTDINDVRANYVAQTGDLWIDPSDYSMYICQIVGNPTPAQYKAKPDDYAAWIEIGGGSSDSDDLERGATVYYDEAGKVPGSGIGSPDADAILRRGDLWIDSDTLITYVWNDLSGAWISTTGDLNAIFDNRFEVTISPGMPPAIDTKAGDLWFDSELAEMRMAYVPSDSDGSFVWVPVQGSGLKAAPTNNAFSAAAEVDELRSQVMALEARIDAMNTNY